MVFTHSHCCTALNALYKSDSSSTKIKPEWWLKKRRNCQMVKETKKLRHRESKRPISMANTIENLSIDYEKLIIRIGNSLKLQFQ